MAATPAGEPAAAPRWHPDDFFDLRNWLGVLGSFTFPTVVVPITLRQAVAVKKYNEIARFLLLYHALTREDAPDEVKRTGKLPQDVWEAGFQDDDYVWVENALVNDPQLRLPDSEMQPIHELVTLVDQAIAELDAAADGVFVKLSSRSPKDSALWSAPTFALIRQLVAEARARSSPPLTEADWDVEDLLIFFRAISRAMCVHTGADAVRMILRSGRCNTDISQGELFAHTGSLGYHKIKLSPTPQATVVEPPAGSLIPEEAAPDRPFALQLVVRRWCPAIDPVWEFRCFVYQGQITAITQYGPTYLVPGMYEQRAAIADRIVTFWTTTLKQPLEDLLENYAAPLTPAQREERAVPLGRESPYTIDFALSPDLQQVWVIEINNPPPIAGTSLFKWKNPADRAIIEHGPFEIRIRQSLPPQPLRKLHPPLRALLLSLRPASLTPTAVTAPVSNTNTNTNTSNDTTTTTSPTPTQSDSCQIL